MFEGERHDWTHVQCTACWMQEFGLERVPHRIPNAPINGCCYCGTRTNAGIYRRVRPGSIAIACCPDIPGVLRGS